jgi:hypothetical protein
MRRWFLLGLAIAALVIPGAAVAHSNEANNFEANNFEATLTGAEEVPAVITEASGEAEFELSQDGKSLHFTLEIEDIQNAFMGHIHAGARGENGPVVVWLFPIHGCAPGPPMSGELAFEGTLTQADICPNPKISTFDELVNALRTGQAYANVHTNVNPGGEIRGQIRGDD